MKKSLLTLGIVLTSLLLTGCGKEQKMVCNQKKDLVDINMLVNYKDSKLFYLGLEYKIDLSGYTEEEIQRVNAVNMCSVVKDEFDNNSFGDAFTNCKQNLESNVLKITADFDLAKMDSDELSKETIEDAKAGLEKQGYTCTIK